MEGRLLLRPKPLEYHQRTEHFLPLRNNELQKLTNELTDYANENKLVINTKKTKLMLFNSRIKTDLDPEIFLMAGNTKKVEVVENYKLLGVQKNNKLNWEDNINSMITKAYKRLKRLKVLGVERNFWLTYTSKMSEFI